MLQPKRIIIGILPIVFGIALVGVFFGGNISKHPGPWQLRVSGEGTNIVAVAALAPAANGPTAELAARAATQLDIGLPGARSDQATSRDRAWRAAVSIAQMAYGDALPEAQEIQQPDIEIPEAWFGRSTGLAYMLAFLDSYPLNDKPGSLSNGRIIAATGFVNNYKTLRPVDYIPAKFAAAQEAGADLFLLPGDSYRSAIAQGMVFPTEGTRVVPLRTPREAIFRLCEGGGSGRLCEAIYEGSYLPKPGDLADSSPWWRDFWKRVLGDYEFSTGPRGMPGNRYGQP